MKKKAEKEIEEHFYKSKNKTFYQKTIEKITKRINIDLIDKNDTEETRNGQLKVEFDHKTAKYQKINLHSFNKERITFTNPISDRFFVLQS